MNSTSFEVTGGVRLDWLNTSADFATLSADVGMLKLSCVGKDYIFPKQSIIKLSRHRGVISVGLRIEHTVQSYPQLVVFWASLFFWTSGFRRLKAQLEEIGYEVAE